MVVEAECALPTLATSGPRAESTLMSVLERRRMRGAAFSCQVWLYRACSSSSRCGDSDPKAALVTVDFRQSHPAAQRFEREVMELSHRARGSQNPARVELPTMAGRRGGAARSPSTVRASRTGDFHPFGRERGGCGSGSRGARHAVSSSPGTSIRRRRRAVSTSVDVLR